MAGNIVEDIKFKDVVPPDGHTYNNMYKHTEIVQAPNAIESINQLNSQEINKEADTEKTNNLNETESNKNIKEENEELMKKLKARADRENDVKAMNALAVMAYSSNSMNLSLEYFEKASNLGYSVAQRNLAIMLEKSESPDYSKIIDLYKKASKENDAMAINNLGCCYMNGEGTEVNYNKAVKCFEISASLNDELAKINLANCMSLGLGINKDLTKAYELYNEVAELGNPIALRMTADCHFNGIGTSQNINKAIECYKLAANAGDLKSKEILSQLNEKINVNKHQKLSLEKQINSAKQVVNTANKTKTQTKDPRKDPHLIVI